VTRWPAGALAALSAIAFTASGCEVVLGIEPARLDEELTSALVVSADAGLLEASTVSNGATCQGFDNQRVTRLPSDGVLTPLPPFNPRKR
jgi:hypothetical protein